MKKTKKQKKKHEYYKALFFIFFRSPTVYFIYIHIVYYIVCIYNMYIRTCIYIVVLLYDGRTTRIRNTRIIYVYKYYYILFSEAWARQVGRKKT